jgi:Tol biopolymer transport system component/DNA-binding winged helix-turn-helix (wHTH) protein
MQPSGLSSGRFRFGAFVLDVRTGELRKGSTRLRIPDQSIEVLKALIDRPGELVTREELRQRLWVDDTFVDFEQGLNGIVRRLRDALGDSADTPTYIETLPRRGYRFIGLLEVAETGQDDAASGRPTADAPRPLVSVRPVARLLVFAIAIAAAVGTLIGIRSCVRDRVNPPALKAIPVTSYPGREAEPSISPDGRQVAFTWDGGNGDNFDIYVKLIGRDEHLRLTTNPANERRPAWSPDGQRIAFLRQRPNTRGSTIVIVPVLGGPEELVIDTRTPPGVPATGGLSWTPDSKGVVYLDEIEGGSRSAVFVCWIDTRKREQLTTPPADFVDASPVIAPDGSQLAFVRRFFGFTNGRVLVQPLEKLRPAGDPRTLIDDGAVTVEWTADGRSVIFGQAGSLWRVRAEGGSPQIVYAGAGLIAPSVARQAQRLVFQHVTTDENIWRIEGPSSVNWPSIAPPTEIIASTYGDLSPNISYDGRKVTFRSIRSGVNEIWVSNIDGSDSVQVTHADGRFVGSPRWSPDGAWIAFDSTQPGAFDIYVVSAHGGQMQAVTHGPGNNFRPSWAPDGRWIYFGSTRSGTEQIWKIRSDGSGNAVQLTKNGGFEPIATFDGKFVYYAKSLTGTGIWRVQVDGGDEVKIFDRGIEGAWGLTRQGIVVMDRLAKPRPLIEVYGYDATLLSRALLPAGLRIAGDNPAFSVAPDGSWIVYTHFDAWGSDIEMIDGFR